MVQGSTNTFLHSDVGCLLTTLLAVLFNSRTNKVVLPKYLMILQKYVKKWQLTFSVTKCAVRSIKKKKSEIDYFLANQRLKTVDTHPYLGNELQSNINGKQIVIRLQAKRTAVCLC